MTDGLVPRELRDALAREAFKSDPEAEVVTWEHATEEAREWAYFFADNQVAVIEARIEPTRDYHGALEAFRFLSEPSPETPNPDKETQT